LPFIAASTPPLLFPLFLDVLSIALVAHQSWISDYASIRKERFYRCEMTDRTRKLMKDEREAKDDFIVIAL